MSSADKLGTHIRLLRSSGQRVSKVLVCIDSECTAIEETRARVSPVQGELRERFPNVTFVVVDHSIEGWLMADAEALRSVLGKRVRLPSNWNPESNCRPAKLLANIFRRYRKEPYDKTIDPPRLAEAADPTAIAKASPTFRAFRQALIEA